MNAYGLNGTAATIMSVFPVSTRASAESEAGELFLDLGAPIPSFKSICANVICNFGLSIHKQVLLRCTQVSEYEIKKNLTNKTAERRRMPAGV